MKIKNIVPEVNEGAVTSALGKVGSRLLPGVGLAVGAKDAYDRTKAGDKVGAAIAGATAAASSLPVVGTAASLLGTGVQAARDKFRTGSWFPEPEEIAAASAPAAPKMAAADPAAPAKTLEEEEMDEGYADLIKYGAGQAGRAVSAVKNYAQNIGTKAAPAVSKRVEPTMNAAGTASDVAGALPKPGPVAKPAAPNYASKQGQVPVTGTQSTPTIPPGPAAKPAPNYASKQGQVPVTGTQSTTTTKPGFVNPAAAAAPKSGAAPAVSSAGKRAAGAALATGAIASTMLGGSDKVANPATTTTGAATAANSAAAGAAKPDAASLARDRIAAQSNAAQAPQGSNTTTTGEQPASTTTAAPTATATPKPNTTPWGGRADAPKSTWSGPEETIKSTPQAPQSNVDLKATADRDRIAKLAIPQDTSAPSQINPAVISKEPVPAASAAPTGINANLSPAAASMMRGRDFDSNAGNQPPEKGQVGTGTGGTLVSSDGTPVQDGSNIKRTAGGFTLPEEAELEEGDTALAHIKQLSKVTKESKETHMSMDFKKMFGIMDAISMNEAKMADIKGQKYSGSYGAEYQGDSDDEDTGTTVSKAPAEKKGRGRPKGDVVATNPKDTAAKRASDKESKAYAKANPTKVTRHTLSDKPPKGSPEYKEKKSSLKDWIESSEAAINEAKAKNKYAIGMAVAKKQAGYGEKPAHDLPKKVIKKGHEIAKKIDEQDLDEATELKGGQKKLDVAPPKGKLDAKDFAALRAKKTVKESTLMNDSHDTLAHVTNRFKHEVKQFMANPDMDMDDDLYEALFDYYLDSGEIPYGIAKARTGDPHQWVYNRFQEDMGAPQITSETAMLPEAFDSGETVYWRGTAGTVDRVEGDKCFVHTVSGDMDVWPASECSKEKQGAFSIFKKDVSDIGTGLGRFATGKSEIDEAELEESPFTYEAKMAKAAGKDSFTLGNKHFDVTESKNMDTQLESWNRQLNSLLTESLTISTTQGDQGDDTISVTASGADAQEVMAIMRNAGLGGMGNKQEDSTKFSNYGVPMSGDQDHEGTALITVDDGESGGDDMLSLMKKMSGIGSDESSDDYADEESSDEFHDEESNDEEESGSCNECGMSEGSCEHGQMVDEARADDPDEYEEHDEEDDENPDNPKNWGGDHNDKASWDAARDERKKSKKDEAEEKVDESYANSADDQADQDIDFMMNTISGGLNRRKRDQTTLPHTSVKVSESNDLMAEFLKLSGLK